MLVLKDITLGFGGRMLFDGLDWQMKPQERVALIGGNGAGKSSLMKIIAGMSEADKGEVLTPKGTTFGYLPQEGLSFKGRPLFEEVKSVLSSLLALEATLRQLEQKLEVTPPEDEEHESLLQEYDRCAEQFRQLDGYRAEAEVGRVLDGLGFARDDWSKPCESFSGGWQMRIALARLLLTRPSFLLLDEPTNHLDLEARNWLEAYLCDYSAAVLLVSHDRHFLDVVVHRCTELFQGTLTDYHGNFSFYEVEREKRYDALLEASRRQQEEIEKLERFIERFRYKASKASQVQSRVKQLEKIERIVLPPAPKKVSFSFPPPPRSGRVVLELNKVTKSYDGHHVVLDGVDASIERGERVVLVGANGAGKSTLMRIMAGQESFEGERTVGYQVEFGYFAQDQAHVLHPDHTVLQTLEKIAPYDMIPRLRTLLGCFLFQGEDVDKKVKVLSGGERNRLALARMLLRPANLLLLDEPTNHLDIQAKEVLLDALKRFDGTILFVSHDRYFINELAQRIIEVKDGSLEGFLGNYEAYLQEKLRRGEELTQDDGVLWSTAARGEIAMEPSASSPSSPSSVSSPARESRQQQYFREQERRREWEKKHRKLKKEIEAMERTLEEQEEHIASLEEKMALPGFFDDPGTSRPVIQEYDEGKAQLEQGYAAWESLSHELNELENAWEDESQE